MTRTLCLCGEPLTIPPTGRPPKYCSVPCRRNAEHEVKRQQSLLLRAERAYQDARMEAALGTYPVLQRREQWWASEVDRLADALEQTFLADEQENAP